jgi:hypothetical protein
MIDGSDYMFDDDETQCALDGEKTSARSEEHRGQRIRAMVKEFVVDDFEEGFRTGQISAATMW